LWRRPIFSRKSRLVNFFPANQPDHSYCQKPSWKSGLESYAHGQ
jgi:hypothetical protein